MILIEKIILTSLNILIFIIVIRLWVEIIISYNQSNFNKDKFLFKYLFKITEPFSIPFRQILPPKSMVDISPIFAIAALVVIQKLLAGIFMQFNFVLQIT